MSENRDCKIVQDLLPNYIDKLTSSESNEYIDEHIKSCIVDKSNPMTREEVIALLEEGAKNTNYYRLPMDIYNTVDGGGEYFAKDGKFLTSKYGKPFLWIDGNSKEQILFVTKETSGTPIDREMIDKALITATEANPEYDLMDLAIGVTDYENYEFKYVGEKTIDGKEYIIVKTYFNSIDNYIERKLSRAKVYINKEEKVVEALEVINFVKIFASKIVTKNYIKFNNVTDESFSQYDPSDETRLEQYTFELPSVFTEIEINNIEF